MLTNLARGLSVTAFWLSLAVAGEAFAQGYHVCKQVPGSDCKDCAGAYLLFYCRCDGSAPCYDTGQSCDPANGVYIGTSACANVDGGTFPCEIGKPCSFGCGLCDSTGACVGNDIEIIEGQLSGMGSQCKSPPGFDAGTPDLTCDGVDDNCDGVRDEGCTPEPIDAGFNPPCDSSKRCCETHEFDPLDVAGGNSFLTVTDVPLQDPALDIAFKRSFNSDPAAWRLDNGLRKMPKPYGGISDDGRSLLWWHNYYAFVFVRGELLSVRDTSGGLLRFKTCTGTGCWAPPADLQSGIQERLQRTANGYVLHEPSGRELYFENPLSMEKMDPHHFFLTEVRLRGERVVWLTYKKPAGEYEPCVPEMAHLTGQPMLSELRTRGGALLQFNYMRTSDGPPGLERCVLSSVYEQFGTDSTGRPQMAVAARYTYQNYNSTTRTQAAGRVETATYEDRAGSGGVVTRTESYSYEGGAFTRSVGGQVVMRHEYSDSGRVATSNALSENVSMVWGGSAECDPSSACCSGPLRSEMAQDANAGRGDGLAGAAGFTTRFDIREYTGERLEPGLYRTTDACTVPNACSPGSIIKAYTCPGEGGLVAHLQGERNKRGFWTAYQYQAPPGGVAPEQLELAAVFKGALDKLGTGALETTRFTYSYGNEGRQRVETESRTSALQAGAEARTRFVYDDVTGALRAKVESGWTHTFGVSAGSFQVQQRHRATFYLTRRACSDEVESDPQGRVVEVHGPCWVDSPDAVDCRPEDPVPVTQYRYYGAEAGFPTAGRLKSISQYATGGTTGCQARAPLVTTFSNYTYRGHAQSVQDPNGVVTTYAYMGDRLDSVKVGTAAATTYTYDNGRLRSTYHPKGNYDVSCYRTGTTSGCTGGVLTDKLQWRAKSGDSTASSFTEKVFYTYWPDGTLRSESFRLPCTTSGCVAAEGAEVRRMEYAADAHRRPTLAQTGVGPGAYTETRAYDGADNLVGLGQPANKPPVWCGGVSQAGLPVSPACSAMAYDGADRLVSVASPGDNALPGGQTCFEYDPQGNVSGVKVGCPAGSSCAECAEPTARYVTDDFGNLVSVMLPSAEGAVLREYGPGGEALREQTAQQRSDGVVLEREYDALGRLLQLRSTEVGQAAQVLFRLGYDSAEVPGATCALPQNTQGRLRWREDSFGRTWYSYSPEGWLMQETRVRAGRSDCGGGVDDSPHTVYTRDANGNLLSIRYPHGRTVTYRYGTGGNSDRVSGVDVTEWNGTSWTNSTYRVYRVTWQPFGGLKSYEVFAPRATAYSLIEYLQGGDGTKAPAPGAECSSVRPDTPGDGTGRLRGLWVSSNNSSPTGDVFKRLYTWDADQVVRTDTCVLGSSKPRTETFTYDTSLRLRSASAAALSGSAGGVSYTSRTYGYDVRGERSALGRDCSTGTDAVELAFASGQSSTRLLSARSSCDSAVHDQYAYDADGRVTSKLGAAGLVGGSALGFAYGESGAGASGSATVFKTVQVNGATYSYYFDAFNRRRAKVYPTGIRDEFFHDERNQLLSDRGNVSLLGGQGYVEDDYVWLDGRPVMMIRGAFNESWTRLADSSTSCGRLGEPMSCGIYYPVTDHVGKVVMLLTAGGKVAQVYDYDPFGHTNRVQVSAGSAHPYSPDGTTRTLATLTRAPESGLALQLRVLFGLVDTEEDESFASVADSAPGATALATVGGPARGRSWTAWLSPPSKSAVVSFRSGTPCASRTLGTCDPERSYGGVSVEAFEYRLAEPGVTPASTPLRFPGQYHDAETDLFENWNRYYDPSTGRYLQPEPRAQVDPKAGAWPAYAYATNNPISKFDPNGFEVITMGAQSEDVLFDVPPSGRRHARTPYGGHVEPITECHQDRDCNGKWKFDLLMIYDVHREFQFVGDENWPSGNAPTLGWTLGQHETGHVRHFLYLMSIANGLVKTEGFSSRAECNFARGRAAAEFRAAVVREMDRLSKTLDGP